MANGAECVRPWMTCYSAWHMDSIAKSPQSATRTAIIDAALFSSPLRMNSARSQA